MEIGAYEVERELARGGAGVVYRARHRVRGTLVAIKVLLAQHTTPEETERFRREAEATFRLRHPHVVGVLEFDTHQGHPFLVLELVEGESLQARIEREGTLVVEDLIRIGEQIADALHYAHGMGLVHRDLKPHNVLLEARTGRAVLTDFGIAQFLNDATKETLTVTGEVVGTPAYMSPEQALGDRARIGPASDIYSLAATLYAGLTGRPPFDGGAPLVVMQQVATDPPRDPRELNPRANPALSKLVVQCLAKVPSERGHDAESLREALRDLLARTTGSGQARYRPASKAPLLASVAAVGVAWLLIGLALGRASAPAAAPPAAAARDGASAWWTELPREGADPAAAGLRDLLADRPEPARVALAAAVDAPHGESPGLLWALGLACERLGRWEELAVVGARLAARAPEDPRGRWFQARAELALGRAADALARIADDPSPEAAALRALATRRLQPSVEPPLGELRPESEALDAFPTAVELYPPQDPRREALLRARLARHPRDVLAWVDLALLLGARGAHADLPELLQRAQAPVGLHPRLTELDVASRLRRGGRIELPGLEETQGELERLDVMARQDPLRTRGQVWRSYLALELQAQQRLEDAFAAALTDLGFEFGLLNGVLATRQTENGYAEQGEQFAVLAAGLAPELALPKLAGFEASLIRSDDPRRGEFAQWLTEHAPDAVHPIHWAEVFLAQGLDARAARELTRAPRAAPPVLRLSLILAARAGDAQAAARAYEQLPRDLSGPLDGYAQGLALIRAGGAPSPDATAALEELRRRALARSEAALRQDEGDAALREVTQLSWLGPDPEVQAARARALFAGGLPEQARREIRRLTSTKVDPRTLLAVAEAALRLNYPGEALALAQACSPADPADVAQAQLLVAAAHERFGSHALAVEACEAGLEATPGALRAPLTVLRGIALERLGRWDEASRDLSRIDGGVPADESLWALIPLVSEVRLAQGRAYLAQAHPEQALRAFTDYPRLRELERRGARDRSPVLERALEVRIQLEGFALEALIGIADARLLSDDPEGAQSALTLAERLVCTGHQPRPETAARMNALWRRLMR